MSSKIVLHQYQIMCFFYRDVQSGSASEHVDMTTLQGAEGGNAQREKIDHYLDPKDLYENIHCMQPSGEPVHIYENVQVLDAHI